MARENFVTAVVHAGARLADVKLLEDVVYRDLWEGGRPAKPRFEDEDSPLAALRSVPGKQ